MTAPESEGGVVGWSPGSPEHHEHAWAETFVWCELCGDHDALRCANEPCPDDFDVDYIDLVFHEDPRELQLGG